MKTSFFIYLLLFFTACSSVKDDANGTSAIDRIPFSYHQSRGTIIIKGELQDSIPVKMILDTGIADQLILKASSASRIHGLQKGAPIIYKSGFNQGFYDASRFEDSLTITMGMDTLCFPRFSVVSDDSSLGSIIGENDGILPISSELKNLSVFNSSHEISFKASDIEEYTYSFSTYKDKFGRCVIKDFPLLIRGASVCDRIITDFIIDTGYRGEIAFNGGAIAHDFITALESNAIRVFKKKTSARGSEGRLYYISEAQMLNRPIWVEVNLSPESYKDLFESSSALIGTELLKGFDFWIAFDRDSVYLKEIPYVSILDDLGKNGPCFQGRENSKGQMSIMYLKKDSPCVAAGVQVTDVLSAINGCPYKILRDSLDANKLPPPVVFSIVRNEQEMDLIWDEKLHR